MHLQLGKRVTFKATLKGMGKLADSAIGDIWLPAVTFIFLAVSFGIGLGKLLSGPSIISTLAVSVAWIVYGMIPPFLLLHYTFIGRGSSLAFWSRCALTSCWQPFLLCPVYSVCHCQATECSSNGELSTLGRYTDRVDAPMHGVLCD